MGMEEGVKEDLEEVDLAVEGDLEVETVGERAAVQVGLGAEEMVAMVAPVGGVRAVTEVLVAADWVVATAVELAAGAAAAVADLVVVMVEDREEVVEVAEAATEAGELEVVMVVGEPGAQAAVGVEMVVAAREVAEETEEAGERAKGEAEAEVGGEEEGKAAVVVAVAKEAGREVVEVEGRNRRSPPCLLRSRPERA